MTDSLDNTDIVPLNDSNKETKLPIENNTTETAIKSTENIASTTIPQEFLENASSQEISIETCVQENVSKNVKKAVKRISPNNLMTQLISANTEIQEILLKNKTKTFSVKIQDPITKKFYRIHLSLASY
jgi:replicative DNA helicase